MMTRQEEQVFCVYGCRNKNFRYLALAIEAVSFCGAKDTSGERGASMKSLNEWRLEIIRVE